MRTWALVGALIAVLAALVLIFARGGSGSQDGGSLSGALPRREIVLRMARRAPGLPEEALRRILHEVITVSLDLAEAGSSRPS